MNKSETHYRGEGKLSIAMRKQVKSGTSKVRSGTRLVESGTGQVKTGAKSGTLNHVELATHFQVMAKLFPRMGQIVVLKSTLLRMSCACS